MKLKRAECGHWVPEDMPSVAVTEGGPAGDQQLTLCNQCWDAARGQKVPASETKTERKVIEPEGKAVDMKVTRAKPATKGD